MGYTINSFGATGYLFGKAKVSCCLTSYAYNKFYIEELNVNMKLKIVLRENTEELFFIDIG